MYTSTLDDLSAQEAEVKRLRAKLRGLELEVKETKEANAKNEEKVSWHGYWVWAWVGVVVGMDVDE